MHIWMTAALSFAAGWFACTLYLSVVRWLDRLLDAAGTAPSPLAADARRRAIAADMSAGDGCADIYPVEEWQAGARQEVTRG